MFRLKTKLAHERPPTHKSWIDVVAVGQDPESTLAVAHPLELRVSEIFIELLEPLDETKQLQLENRPTPLGFAVHVAIEGDDALSAALDLTQDLT